MAKKNEKVSWGGPWHFFSLFFWRFLPIFPFFRFLAHFAHFIPPYGRPLITCDPISYFHVFWVQLAHGRHCRQKKSMNFGFFLKNDHFSIFGHFDPCQPPYNPNSWWFWGYPDHFCQHICVKIYIRKSPVNVLKVGWLRSNCMPSSTQWYFFSWAIIPPSLLRPQERVIIKPEC